MSVSEIIPTQEFIERHDMHAEFDAWDSQLLRLEAELPEIAGKKELPDWWYQKDANEWAVRDLLSSDSEPKPEDIFRYMQSYEKQRGLVNSVLGYESDGHPLDQVIYNIGVKQVSSAIAVEDNDGPLHEAIIDLFNSESKRGSPFIINELEMLKLVYGKESELELLGLSGDDFSDRLRSILVTQNMLSAIEHLTLKYDENETYVEMCESGYKWMQKAVSIACGISEQDAAEYTFSAGRTLSGSDYFAADIISKIDYFGIERLRNITKETGIAGLEGYSIKQLERMESFVIDPEALAEALNDHDVTVMLINRSGDHNSVMKNAADTFDDESGRVLFFEINRMGDIYRRMALLHKVGIRPSTMVLSAHSSEGRFSVYDERDKTNIRQDTATIAGQKLVRMANASSEFSTQKDYAMHGMEGFARLIEEYMQPSRGIDDPESEKGRKKIIFQVCNAGSRTEQNELDDDNQLINIGTESVISQLGKDLLKSGVKSGVDIYGAATGIQMHRSKEGVYYSSLNKETYERERFNATRVRINDGRLQQHRVKEIKLHVT